MLTPFDVLESMLDNIAKITSLTQSINENDFKTQWIMQDAMIRRLEIIGEAASQLPAEIRDTYPHVPWREITGMRNRLIHAYFQVDLDIVWETAIKAIPILEQQLITIRDALRP